ncbi:hypothetical protein [Halorubrum vacuolatum]|uniref:Uncharacterized protein n=1 Tax=Halorubrum vacuolatum TaxID=63740 RepID=A0A238UWJ6_HALVU|nr:hypothetical protein [Halorubrum vacuolatum]SNR25703.1 hypothetical protein SAMN06264855_101393 [Halorubrum vacuolatum]
MNRKRRILAIGFLLVVTVGMNVPYATTDLRSSPEKADVSSNPAQFDGEDVFYFVQVDEVDEREEALVVVFKNTSAVGIALDGLRVDTEDVVHDRHEVTIRPVDPSVIAEIEPGARIQVFGTLSEESSVLVAEEIVVDYRDSRDWIYVLGISLFGMSLAIVHFFRYWHPNPSELSFQKRGES